MPTVFKNSPSTGSQNVGATRTVMYGPVAASTTAVIYDGTITNIDSAGQADQLLTIEILRVDGVTYDISFGAFNMTIPYGAAWQLPKGSLATGESLVMTGGVAGKLAAKIMIVEIS